jgi:kynurenine formamidase
LEYRDITRTPETLGNANFTVAHFLPQKAGSLSEFCGYCACLDLTANDNVQAANLKLQFDNCVSDIGNSQKHLNPATKREEVKRWLVKTRGEGSTSPTQITPDCVEFFKSQKTVLVGFDCPIAENLASSFAANGIATLENLKLDDLFANQRGMLFCGPLKIEGKLAVPCRAVLVL